MENRQNKTVKAKKSIFSLISALIVAVIFIIIAIVVLSCKSGWIEKIVVAITEAAIESGDLQVMLRLEETITKTRKNMNTVFTVVAVICFAIAALTLLLKLLRLASQTLKVSDGRVTGKTGITRVKKTDVKCEEVNVAVNTTFWGRIFKFDTLEIKSKGDVGCVEYKGITNTDEIKNAINATSDNV